MTHLASIAAGFAAALAVSACTETTTTTVVPATITTDTCGASAWLHLIGQPQSALSGARFTGPTRIIPDGAAVTMDISPARLNFYLNRSGIIERVACG